MLVIGMPRKPMMKAGVFGRFSEIFHHNIIIGF